MSVSVGRKPERAVHAKIRDSKNKTKQNKHDHRSTSSSTMFFWIGTFYPRNVYSPSVAAYAGLYPVTILIHPGGIIPIEDCRVFVMRRRVTFHLTCPILFHQIYHSYNHTSQSSIQSYKSCRHSGIHTYTHSCIYNKDNIMRTWLH